MSEIWWATEDLEKIEGLGDNLMATLARASYLNRQPNVVRFQSKYSFKLTISILERMPKNFSVFGKHNDL